MMNVKELRLGNLVESSIEEIGMITVLAITTARNTHYVNACDIEYIIPIKLTEERLLEFGFEKTDGGIGWDYFKKGDFMLTHVPTNKGKIPAIYNEKSGKYKYILYVHQLQNLYFALEQKEL